MNSSAKTLLALINDILNMSRAEAEKITTHCHTFDLYKMIHSVTQLFFFQAEEKGLHLLVTIDPDIPFMLKGAEQHLKRVLINLIGNAIKFTDQGEISVKLLHQSTVKEKIVLRFEVSDTGIGIPEKARPYLFDKFVQLAPSIARRYEGTGLRLSITKQLVEVMGGKIGMRSIPGNGSCFWFDLQFECPAEYIDQGITASMTHIKALVLSGHASHSNTLLDFLRTWGRPALIM